ncbi:hypothetical protein BDDG_06308 [Blastomyces dermatitidis ATCC 18188]|uniref:Sialidase n=1 Tax=Ajellomyces dermatitidis (strain ATCC 18188 / CBS 674.68) TaxID=653446 RepID=F2TJF1_AJEDA|nr:hypothetical protein BDDG_06308 [Blastomyces dermatitidis ATCC 18188]EQL36221.1 hypothetical protein BDFG_02191 [Blastomyces dermatitidis ATCC 26199]
MSSELYYLRPSTPPPMMTTSQYAGNHHTHARADSSSSNNSSPDSSGTNLTTPSLSPVIRQHGPALLPKIRPQDLVVEPVSSSGPIRHRKGQSTVRKSNAYSPYPASRSQMRGSLTSPIDCSLISPISTSSMLGHRAPSTTLSSPVTLTPSHTRLAGGHSRSTSTSSIDEATWARYGYPTYRQYPRYVTQCSPTTPVSATSFLFSSYLPLNEPVTHPEPSPLLQPAYYAETPVTTLGPPIPAATVTTPPYSDSDDLELSTTLLKYLTEPTQAINLVQHVRVPVGRGQQHHFWWDIRNLRSWSSFSLSTIHSIPKLTALLTTQVSQDHHPLSTVTPSRLSPSSEGALSELIRDIYAPRVNAAIQTSIGNGLFLRPTAEAFLTGNRSNSGPHFIANYATDIQRTASGSQRGRLVGLVKSFNCWNSGMRQEPPHKRVEYLNGLAHLQRCMREHSCRYGFIITEIELVCVRAGCDDSTDIPYFGYLQVAPPIMTNLSSESYCPPTHQQQQPSMTRSHSHRSSSAQSSDYSPTPSRSPTPPSSFSSFSSASSSSSTPLTATLALYYLVLLSKAEALPSQPHGYLNVGGHGTLTRQHVLPEGKDKWIPEPQTGEKRDAKRVRGWVWPQDPWHRREGGGVVGSRAKAHQQNGGVKGGVGKGKKWHK